MERILVTGGAGFIGCNLVRYLLDQYRQSQIIVLDKITYAGNLANLAGVAGRPNYEFVLGDIADPGDVEQVFSRGVDGVLNLAAESHVDRSIADPSSFIRTNVLGTQVLLDASRRHQIHRFLQVSTDEVYGSLGPEGRFLETSPLAPNSPYAASKAAADLLVRAYYATYGLPVIITRCSNNYGPFQYPEKLIPLMTIKAIRGEPLPVYGDGQNVRDWIHVEDHCRALDLALHHGRVGEVYNVGANNEKRNLDIAGLVLGELNCPDGLLSFVPDRLGHDRRYAVDAGKMRKELGWAPRMEFSAGLKETIGWYRTHSSWWKPLLPVA